MRNTLPIPFEGSRLKAYRDAFESPKAPRLQLPDEGWAPVIGSGFVTRSEYGTEGLESDWTPILGSGLVACTGYGTEPVEIDNVFSCWTVQSAFNDARKSLVSFYVDSLMADDAGQPSRPLNFARLSHLGHQVDDEPWRQFLSKLEQGWQPGWDGYDAPAPNETAIRNARQFLIMMRFFGCVPTRVAPSALGGIGITKREGQKKAYIEFFNSGLISALLAHDQTQELSTVRVEQGISQFKKTIQTIEDFLSG